MLKIKKLLLLTGITCFSLFNINSMNAQAAEYKIVVDGDTKLDDTISTIKLDGINLKMTDGSPFSFNNISADLYYIMTTAGECVGKVDISNNADDIIKKIVDCEKSTFISENLTITDIIHEDVENGTVTFYKENDRKFVIYTNGVYYVKLSSLSSDKVIYGNNYINKVLDNITVSFDGE